MQDHTTQTSPLAAARADLARRMAAAAGQSDPRFARAFAAVPREAFLPPGPWRVSTGHGYATTPDADPIHLYQNILVALDEARGINIGEPLLHAAWLGLVAPAPGEAVVQVGGGTGYYTALLAELVGRAGRVAAYEIEPTLAARAAANLAGYDNVTVIAADASLAALPSADIVYVCAGVVAPPLGWLDAMTPGGRLILPWQPAPDIGLTLLITRCDAGFAITVAWRVGFIPCFGAGDARAARRAPTPATAPTVRSLHPTAARAPDASAVAIYPDVWFSSEPAAGARHAKDLDNTTLT